MRFSPEAVLAPIEQLLESPEMLHAAAVHLPVALAGFGLPIALLALIPMKAAQGLRWAGAACYGLLILCAYGATQSGEGVLELVPSTLPAYIWEDVNQHESMAEKVWIFGAVTCSLFILSLITVPAVRRTAMVLALGGSVATLGWVIQVGHHGGTLVYEHGLGTPPLYVETHRYTESSSNQGDAAVDPGGGEGAIQEARLREVSYIDDVRPILQEYCTDCHSPSEREGGLDLTSLDGIGGGGEKAGPAIRIDAPAESPILLYVRGERQPRMPKEEPALSDEKISVLEQWILNATPESLERDFGAQAGDGAALLAKAAMAVTPTHSVTTLIRALLKSEDTAAKARAAREAIVLPNPQTLGKAIENHEAAFEKRQELIKRARKGLISTGHKPVLAPSDEEKEAAKDGIEVPFRPEEDEYSELKQLRTAMLAEHPPDASRDGTSPEARSHRYALRGPEAYLNLRRDLRKQWLPTPPDLPESAASQNPIDRFISAKLIREDLNTEIELCDDTAFLRRVYLDLIGVIPPAEEARSFLRDTSPDKREGLIDRLLARNEDYAANWVPFWEDALCSTHRNPNISPFGKHGDYREWIFDSFKENKPFDIWVRELFDPFMLNHPQSYILRRTEMDILQSAANTSQVFLGTSMKCASCHNHFSNAEWTQTRFYSFASFMNEKDMEVVRCEKPTGRIAPAKFPWDLPEIDITAPKAPNGDDLTSPYRLSRFAELLTDPTSPRFATTFINRLWKRYIGVGLIEPADDVRLDTPISHPDLLDWMANDFIEHNYDVKYAVRQILMSETYQRKYRDEFEDSFSLDDPNQPRYYRSPALRRLWAEQLLDSVSQALGKPWQGYARTYWEDEVNPFMVALGRPASRDEVSTARLDEGGTVMALELLNSPDFYERIYDSLRLRELVEFWVNGMPLEDIIVEIYYAVLSRPPSESELELATAFLGRDVSSEFVDPIKRVKVESFSQAIENVMPGGTIEIPAMRGNQSLPPTRIATAATLRASEGPVRIGRPPTDASGQPKKVYRAAKVTGFWVETASDPLEPQLELLGDLFWALFTSPEFQYIR